MNSPIVQAVEGVTLVGAGPVSARDLARARVRAPVVVAADGGANRLLPFRVQPQAVIGDLDSLSAEARAATPPDRLHLLPDQATTDFDKALRSIEAPFVLALGFAGARIDHGLAVMNTLVRHANRRCLVLGPKDLAFAAPPELHLRLRPGDPVSLFPLAPVRGRSEGLEWPIEGLHFAPDGFIGTSNRATGAPVRLAFEGPGMIVILPRARLDAAITALRAPPPRQKPPAPGASVARGG